MKQKGREQMSITARDNALQQCVRDRVAYGQTNLIQRGISSAVSADAADFAKGLLECSAKGNRAIL